MDKALEAGALAELELQRLTTIAMRAFEPMLSVLRYREVDKWHTSDVIGMREAVKVIFAELRPAALPAADTSGLVERLRARNERFQGSFGNSRYYNSGDSVLDREAACRIEALELDRTRLAAENERLTEALKPFARAAITYIDAPLHKTVKARHVHGLTFGHFGAARAALSGGRDE